MRRATFLAAARNDLVDILVHLTETSGSLAVGQAFVARLRAQCDDLAGLPGTLGRVRSELRDDIRSFPYRNYIVFFHYRGDVFEVINILHARRDIDDHFTDIGDAP